MAAGWLGPSVAGAEPTRLRGVSNAKGTDNPATNNAATNEAAINEVGNTGGLGTRSLEPVRAPGGFPVVGIIGAGQLARMCQPPAVNLGVTLSILAESETGAAALVVPSAPVGAASDVERVVEWARHCDVVTFDHEHIPAPVLEALEAEGIPTHPRASALRYAQDKLAMRELMSWLRIGSPRSPARWGGPSC